MSQYFLSNELEDESLSSLTVKTDLNEFIYAVYHIRYMIYHIPRWDILRWMILTFHVHRLVRASYLQASVQIRYWCTALMWKIVKMPRCPTAAPKPSPFGANFQYRCIFVIFCHDKFATTHVTQMKIHLGSDQYDLMRLVTVHVQG